jgi:hypothetical protein
VFGYELIIRQKKFDETVDGLGMSMAGEKYKYSISVVVWFVCYMTMRNYLRLGRTLTG